MAWAIVFLSGSAQRKRAMAPSITCPCPATCTQHLPGTWVCNFLSLCFLLLGVHQHVEKVIYLTHNHCLQLTDGTNLITKKKMWRYLCFCLKEEKVVTCKTRIRARLGKLWVWRRLYLYSKQDIKIWKWLCQHSGTYCDFSCIFWHRDIVGLYLKLPIVGFDTVIFPRMQNN